MGFNVYVVELTDTDYIFYVITETLMSKAVGKGLGMRSEKGLL